MFKIDGFGFLISANSPFGTAWHDVGLLDGIKQNYPSAIVFEEKTIMHVDCVRILIKKV